MTERRAPQQPVGPPVQQMPMGQPNMAPQQQTVMPQQQYVAPAPQTNAIFCQNCGAQLDANEMQMLEQRGKVFCKNCGAEVTGE